MKIPIGYALVGLMVLSVTFNGTGQTQPQTQDQQSPPAQQQLTSEQWHQMLTMMEPWMSKMMDTMFEVMFTTLAKPQTAERLATYTKQYYDALLAKGFTREEALKIVTSTNIPSMPSMK